MKKLITITKKTIILIGVVSLVGLIGSCDKNKVTKFTWDESDAPTLISLSSENVGIGEEVTITGKYFSSTAENSVSFNGIAATITSANISIIKVIVPEGASDGDITVTSNGKTSTNSLPYTIFVPVSYSVTVEITASWDDVEEGGLNGAMANESSDLEIGEYDTWEQDGVAQGVQTIGLRFNNIDIPAGATILSANLQFTCDATGSDPCEMTIYAEKVGNALPFTEDAYNVTSRTRTVENVVWTVPPWLEKVAGPEQKTPDIFNVVNEVCTRADWSAGNSMVFILAPSGGSADVTSSSAGREAEAIDGTAATVLTIVYEL